MVRKGNWIKRDGLRTLNEAVTQFDGLKSVCNRPKLLSIKESEWNESKILMPSPQLVAELHPNLKVVPLRRRVFFLVMIRP